MRQIEFQVRIQPKYDSTVGLLDLRIARYLKLTDEQKSEMKVIGEELNTLLRESSEKIAAERKLLEVDLKSSLDELL